jgi:hypothetical protein
MLRALQRNAVSATIFAPQVFLNLFQAVHLTAEPLKFADGKCKSIVPTAAIAVPDSEAVSIGDLRGYGKEEERTQRHIRKNFSSFTNHWTLQQPPWLEGVMVCSIAT